ncbi:MAG: maltokinase N-terminal cap-like domain-containing protein [Streptosporangiaceae bacterium]
MTQNALAELLAGWLPAQRWFAGSGATVRLVGLASDVSLADGDPELRHLIADAWVGEEKVSYQVLLGIRADLPPFLTSAAIGRLPDGRMAYDGACDPALAALLLGGIAAGRQAGPLRFVREPGAVISQDAPARPLPALASNTSIVFGEQAILKLLRRPFTGHHPDLEVPAALARNGSALVAAPRGWIEMPGSGQIADVQDLAAATLAPDAPRASDASGGSGDGQQVVLAILSDFFANASDGWALAAASVNERGPGFAAQAGLLGEDTARLHAEMAAAFGTSVLSRYALKDLTDAMTTELRRAIRVVPRLNEYAAGIRDCYAALAEPDTQVPVQRIHGDYHLAQVLHTGRGWVILDFEGEPSVPLARRRAFAPALRDVAGMLRSFDYAGRHQVLRRPDDGQLAETAARWVQGCQEAFCLGYAKVTGADPGASGPLLRALILQKAVYEAVYEASHRPDWLPIPLAAIAEASR